MPERPFTRDQVYLLPPALDEWVAADDPVRYVAAFVDARAPVVWARMGWALDAALTGAPRYSPRLLLSAWLYGFMCGERSSRAIERLCRTQIAARWLTANQCPDHNTLWRFYAAHRDAMRQLLTESVRTAVQCGLVELAVLAVDGTKLGANAATDRSLTAAQLTGLLARLDAEIAALEAQHEGGDDGPDPRLPAEHQSATALRARVVAALADLEAQPIPAKRNLTDPDAVFMKTRQGLALAYNAQAAVVATSAAATALLPAPSGRFIVAADVIAANPDVGQLAPLIAQAEANLTALVGLTVADGGYASGPDLAAAATAGYAVLTPEPMQTTPYHLSRFAYDAATDTVACPQGHTLHRIGTTRNWRKVVVPRYGGAARQCRVCPAFGVCTTNGARGRTIQVPEHHQQIAQIRHLRESPPGRVLLGQRTTLIEPVFGIIKEVLAGRRVLVRGLAKVQAEWATLATAFNLRTLARFWQANQLTPA
jgi:transposase